jgi:hypothetical protein
MVEPIIEFLIIKLRSYPSINIEFSKILLVNWALGTYPYLVSLGVLVPNPVIRHSACWFKIWNVFSKPKTATDQKNRN